MSLTDRYQAYADAFEVAYDSDTWDGIREYFTDNAVYEGIGDPMSFKVEGADEVVGYLKNAVTDFDRKFASRRLEVRAPVREEGNTVTMEWAAIYTAEGAPELRMEGIEVATFEGDRIIRLEDTFADGTAQVMGAWMAEHGAKLGG